MTKRTPAQPPSDPMRGLVSFTDVLGVRVVDPANAETIERLVLCPELAPFETPLRERVARLGNFRHVRFTRVRAIDVQGTGAGRVVSVTFDRTSGVRLSEPLHAAERGELVIDVNAALQIAREVLPALAVLHDSRNVVHGAIAPERLVLTPQARVVIVDHVFASAIEKLQYPRTRLWKEFRIAVPPSAGLPRLDARSDVGQVALAVFCLVVGRPLALKEFPDGLRALLQDARERVGTGPWREMSPALRSWFERALPIDSRKPFTTALDAQVALEETIKRERAYSPAPSALKGFLERYTAWEAAQRTRTSPGVGVAEASLSAPARPARQSRRANLRVVARAEEDEEAEEIRQLEEELARLAREEQSERAGRAGAPESHEAVAERTGTSDEYVDTPVVDTTIVDTTVADARERTVDVTDATAPPMADVAAGSGQRDGPPGVGLEDEPGVLTLDLDALVEPVEAPTPASDGEVASAEAVASAPDAARGPAVASEAAEPSRAPVAEPGESASLGPATPWTEESPAAPVAFEAATSVPPVEGGHHARPDPDVQGQAADAGTAPPDNASVAVSTEPDEFAHLWDAINAAAAREQEATLPLGEDAAARIDVDASALTITVADSGLATADADGAALPGLEGATPSPAAATQDEGEQPPAWQLVAEMPDEWDAAARAETSAETELADEAPADDLTAPLPFDAEPEFVGPTAMAPASRNLAARAAAHAASAAGLSVDAMRRVASRILHADGDATHEPGPAQRRRTRTRRRPAGAPMPPAVAALAPDATPVESGIAVASAETLLEHAAAHSRPLRMVPAATLEEVVPPAPAALRADATPVESGMALPAAPGAVATAVRHGSLLRFVDPPTTRLPKAPAPAAALPPAAHELVLDESVPGLPEADAGDHAGIDQGAVVVPGERDTCELTSPATTQARGTQGAPDQPRGVEGKAAESHAALVELPAPQDAATGGTPGRLHGAEARPAHDRDRSAWTWSRDPNSRRSASQPADDVFVDAESFELTDAVDDRRPTFLVRAPAPAVPNALAAAAGQEPPATTVANEALPTSEFVEHIVDPEATVTPVTASDACLAESPAVPAETAEVIGSEAEAVIASDEIPVVPAAPLVIGSEAVDAAVVDDAPRDAATPAVVAPETADTTGDVAPEALTAAVDAFEVAAEAQTTPVAWPDSGVEADVVESLTGVVPVGLEASQTGETIENVGDPTALADVAMPDAVAATQALAAGAPVDAARSAEAPAVDAGLGEAPSVESETVESPVTAAAATAPGPEVDVELPAVTAGEESPAAAVARQPDATSEFTRDVVEADEATAPVAAADPVGGETTVVDAAAATNPATTPVAEARTEVEVAAASLSATAADLTEADAEAPEVPAATDAAAADVVEADAAITDPVAEVVAPFALPGPVAASEVSSALSSPEPLPIEEGEGHAPATVAPPQEDRLSPSRPAPRQRAAGGSRRERRRLERSKKQEQRSKKRAGVPGTVEPVVAEPAAAAAHEPGVHAARESGTAAAPEPGQAVPSASVPTVVPFVPPWRRGIDAARPPSAEAEGGEAAAAGQPAAAAPPRQVAPWLRGKTVDAPLSEIEPEDTIVNFESDEGRGFYATASDPLAVPRLQAQAPAVAAPHGSDAAGTSVAERVIPVASSLEGDRAGTDSVVPRRPRSEATPAPAIPVAPAVPARRVEWKRTAAAALVLVLLETAAFGAAYWYVKPKDLGYLVVKSNVPGIEVIVDGRVAGRTPASVELPPGRHNLELRGLGMTKVLSVEITAGVQTTQAVQWPKSQRVGRLVVKSTPPGARVKIGYEDKGVTPVTIDNVPAGPTEVLLESDNGSVTSSVQVKPDQVAEVNVGIYSGWLAVFAPVEIRVFEGGKLIGTSLDGRLMMKPGTHTLEMVNPSLGIQQSRQVEITPGRVTAVSLQLPGGTIQVDAPAGTEVIVDGELKGTTPVDGVSVAAGTREVVLRHPQIGQRRFVVTVGVKAPARVSLMAPQ